jgi:hypothetical protein
MMIRVCAWCKSVMGKIDCTQSGESHGICRGCVRTVLLADPESGALATGEKEIRKNVDIQQRPQ